MLPPIVVSRTWAEEGQEQQLMFSTDAVYSFLRVAAYMRDMVNVSGMYVQPFAVEVRLVRDIMVNVETQG